MILAQSSSLIAISLSNFEQPVMKKKFKMIFQFPQYAIEQRILEIGLDI